MKTERSFLKIGRIALLASLLTIGLRPAPAQAWVEAAFGVGLIPTMVVAFFFAVKKTKTSVEQVATKPAQQTSLPVFWPSILVETLFFLPRIFLSRR